jgi:arylsulfatase A-like enzyme
VLQRWGSDLARPVVAGFLLLVVEAGVVAATGGDLFLDAGEPLRYLAAALPLLVCLCVTGWALASIVLRASGAARPVPRRAPIGPVARRAGLAAAAIAAPVTALALYLVSDGRRLRDVPGRPFLVVLGGLSVGALLFWIVARLVRKARAGETRELRAFAAFAAGVALAAVVADATLLRRLYPSLHWTLSGVALSGALLAAAAWPARVTGGVKVFVLSVVFFAAAPLSVWLLRDASNASFVVERSAPLTGKVVRALRRGGDGLGTAGPRPEPTPRAAPTAGIDLRDRDVLLVTVDALRADRLRALGGSGIAPHMDALAAEGALFRRAYSSTPTTSYAVGSLLTGKYLEAAMDLADAPREHPTIAELLARHGYQTAAFYPPAIFFVDEERFADMEADGFGFAHREVGFTGADARVVDASAWLREASPDAPVFVWAHFFEPHEPYDPPDGYERGATLAERYDGEVAAVDNALAELVAAFRRERPGATIILTADHGEELGDHGGHYHGTTLYDEQVRIPLIWSSPGVVEPAVYDVPVDLPDIATTLLAALGVPRDARMRGDDLGPVLGGHPDLGPSHAFAVVGDEHMATDGLLKAICAIGAEGCRLYDLVRDPEERRNLGTEREADVARLRGALSQHLSSIPSGEMRARREGGPPPELARAELGDPTVGPELVPLLGSEDPEVRAAAAGAGARGRQ